MVTPIINSSQLLGASWHLPKEATRPTTCAKSEKTGVSVPIWSSITIYTSVSWPNFMPYSETFYMFNIETIRLLWKNHKFWLRKYIGRIKVAESLLIKNLYVSQDLFPRLNKMSRNKMIQDIRYGYIYIWTKEQERPLSNNNKITNFCRQTSRILVAYTNHKHNTPSTYIKLKIRKRKKKHRNELDHSGFNRFKT